MNQALALSWVIPTRPASGETHRMHGEDDPMAEALNDPLAPAALPGALPRALPSAVPPAVRPAPAATPDAPSLLADLSVELPQAVRLQRLVGLLRQRLHGAAVALLRLEDETLRPVAV
ncbi:MAG: hypothetical protein MK041_08950, partial [Aquabacterium sp.]|nr:hypothetical protein [Aquabacterium sp.]